MARPEQFGFPLMIAAAVGTVWLLFRRSPAVASSQNSPIINMPSIGGLPTQYLFGPGNSPALNADYITAAISDPLSSDPISDSAPAAPGYLTYNTVMPSFPQLLQQSESGGGKCSCGGSCGGGCSACAGPPCKSGVYANAGRSTCLTGQVKDPSVPISGYAISSFYENNYGGAFGATIPETVGSL